MSPNKDTDISYFRVTEQIKKARLRSCRYTLLQNQSRKHKAMPDIIYYELNYSVPPNEVLS